MRLIFSFIILLSFAACQWEEDFVTTPCDNCLPVRPDEGDMLIQHDFCMLINAYSTELWWHHQFMLENSYATKNPDGSYSICIDYRSQAIYDINGARRVSVRIVDDLLELFNANPDLQAVQGRPFTTEDLYLNIEYESYFGRYVDPLIVGRTALEHGYMNVFYAHTAFEIDPVIWHKHCEPYETSQCIVYTQDEVSDALTPTGTSIFDRLVAPEDWMAGDPDYVRKPPPSFDSYNFNSRSTLSNYPRYEYVDPSGGLSTKAPADNIKSVPMQERRTTGVRPLRGVSSPSVPKKP